MFQRIRTIATSWYSGHRATRTVKYMLSATAFSVAAIMLSAAALTSVEGSYVKLKVSDSAVAAGDTIAVDVYAYAHMPVNAVDITIAFESTAVKVVGVDRGESVLTIWTEDPIIQKDKVILRGGTFRRGFVKEHLIATINLQALQTGQKTIKATDVVLLAGDGSGSKVKTIDTPDKAVSVYFFDENTDPSAIGVNAVVRIVTDIDGDGKVTLSDISAFMAAWSNRSIVYDFNNDNRMTFRDFSIILADFFLK